MQTVELNQAPAASAKSGSAGVSHVVERRSLATRVALVRVVFGLIWAVDAWLKWQPDFIAGFEGTLVEAAKDQPAFLKPWFDFWIHAATLHPPVLACATVGIETLIAISLIIGLARRPIYVVGLVFSLLVWATGEGFGGPYAPGATDVGTAIIYAVVFLLLLVVDDPPQRSVFAVDSSIERRVPRWDMIARLPR